MCCDVLLESRLVVDVNYVMYHNWGMPYSTTSSIYNIHCICSPILYRVNSDPSTPLIGQILSGPGPRLLAPALHFAEG